jgi:hypothetical protein
MVPAATTPDPKHFESSMHRLFEKQTICEIVFSFLFKKITTIPKPYKEEKQMFVHCLNFCTFNFCLVINSIGRSRS